LDKTANRFIGEAVYGIMASQSVMHTEIGRQLESQISLKKIEERFSRQLINPKIWANIHDRVLSMAKARVKEDTLLILDLSDLKKKYAEKKEHMATVRDGSDRGELVHGYWTNQVIDRGGDRDKLYRSLLQHKRDFIVRLVGSRDLIYQDNKVRSLWLAFGCRAS